MILVYAAVKFAAYSGWCYAGLRAFRPEGEARWTAACGYGVLRGLMGLFLGVGIWLLSSMLAGPLDGSHVLIYLTVYVPVRWFEWAIMDVLIAPEPATFSSFWLGRDGRSRGWRLRGIVISCLADIPVIVSLGGLLPVGRFMC